MSDPKPNLSRAQADLEAWKTWKGDPTEQHLLEVHDWLGKHLPAKGRDLRPN